MKSDHAADYSQITDYIFIGSDLCQGNVCPVHSKEFKTLKICSEIDLDLEHDEPVTPNLDIYLRLPVSDHQAPSLQQLLIGAYTIDQTVTQQKRVYVHCHNGHGRSPAVVAAYFIQFQHVSVLEAIALIKERRPEIHLNSLQIAALEQFKQSGDATW